MIISAIFLIFLVLQIESASDRGGTRDNGSLKRRAFLSNILNGSPITGPPGSSGLLGGLSNLLGAGPNSLLDPAAGGLSSLLEGVPRYDAAALTAGPRPPSTPGDAPWTQSEIAYRKMITCPNGIGGRRGVVLLVPPTGGNGIQAWAKSPYALGLPQQGFSSCWVDNPTKGTGDVQLSAEFVAYAIKYLAAQSGRPIGIVTYSQGGLDAQWALTFWVSTRPLVSNMITLAAPFHGTAAANVICPLFDLIGGCLPALFQQMADSKLVRALNAPVPGSGATALVPTTSVYTLMDQVVTPQVGRVPISALPGASNIALQDICGPAHIADHFLIAGDLTSYAIVLDALLNGRPANPATVDRSSCNQLGSLGNQVGNLANDLKYAFATLVGNTSDRIGSILKTVTTLRVPTEPPLQMYVCQRGFATGCTANGFNGPQTSAPILSSLPRVTNGIVPVLGNLL